MEQRIKKLNSKERGLNAEDDSFWTTRGPRQLPEDPNSSLEVGTGWLYTTVHVTRQEKRVSTIKKKYILVLCTDRCWFVASIHIRPSFDTCSQQKMAPGLLPGASIGASVYQTNKVRIVYQTLFRV